MGPVADWSGTPWVSSGAGFATARQWLSSYRMCSGELIIRSRMSPQRERGKLLASLALRAHLIKQVSGIGYRGQRLGRPQSLDLSPQILQRLFQGSVHEGRCGFVLPIVRLALRRQRRAGLAKDNIPIPAI